MSASTSEALWLVKAVSDGTHLVIDLVAQDAVLTKC